MSMYFTFSDLIIDSLSHLNTLDKINGHRMFLEFFLPGLDGCQSVFSLEDQGGRLRS